MRLLRSRKILWGPSEGLSPLSISRLFHCKKLSLLQLIKGNHKDGFWLLRRISLRPVSPDFFSLFSVFFQTFSVFLTPHSTSWSELFSVFLKISCSRSISKIHWKAWGPILWSMNFSLNLSFSVFCWTWTDNEVKKDSLPSSLMWIRSESKSQTFSRKLSNSESWIFL